MPRSSAQTGDALPGRLTRALNVPWGFKSVLAWYLAGF
jgi:hypothetical protein